MYIYIYIYLYFFIFFLFVTAYNLPGSDSWTYHLCSHMFHASFRVVTKTVHSFSCVIPSSMGPKAKLVEKPRKGKQQRYEEKREKRRSILMAEYQLLLLARERSSMSEEDRNVVYSCEEEADTKEGMRMQIEDLQSQLGRSDLMRQKLQRQVLGLKLKINTLLSKREHM